MLRAQGLDADVVNLLSDDLADDTHGPYAAVLANAVFLHFTPSELSDVLAKVRAALSPDGVLGFSVKAGDGTEWSNHKLGRAITVKLILRIFRVDMAISFGCPHYRISQLPIPEKKLPKTAVN